MANIRSKYHNTRCEYDGLKFDSIKEMNYYKQLLVLKNAKNYSDRVTDIICQYPFFIAIDKPAGKTVIGKYIADFLVTYADGRKEVIDVKGIKTALYKFKKKIVEAMYDVKIIEK